MKKNLFFATLFIAGAAKAGFAQLSAGANKIGTSSAILSRSMNLQDTTKPTQDSASVRF